MPTYTRGDQPQDSSTYRSTPRPTLPAPDPRFTACFSVVAGADPATMPRLANVFAKRGLTPSSWHGVLVDGETVHVDIQLAGATQDLTDHLAQELRQMVLVDTVLTSQKLEAAGV